MKVDLSIIESQIYSKLKSDVISSVGTEFGLKDDNFSTVDNDPSESVFPFIFFELIGGIENGYDLEATSINGGIFTFQIDVYDNESQTRIKKVMDSVTASMKSMGFEQTMFPLNSNTSSVYRKITRFRRRMDDGETI